MIPQELRERILYQDAHLIVLDKPAGLAVHGGPQTSVHVEGMLDALRFTYRQPPRLAHRLDRDTSGCLILARHDKALSRLGRLFTAGRIEKTYWAVVAGCPNDASGRIDVPVKKVSNRQGWRMVAAADGQPAATRWVLRGQADTMAWLELRPESGRTHQIRVHCASGLGCPILGDPVYGPPSERALHLQARAIVIPYAAGRPPIQVTAPPPAHMRPALAACGWHDDHGALSAAG